MSRRLEINHLFSSLVLQLQLAGPKGEVACPHQSQLIEKMRLKLKPSHCKFSAPLLPYLLASFQMQESELIDGLKVMEKGGVL